MGHALDTYIRKQIRPRQTIQNECLFHGGRVESTCIELVRMPIALFLTNTVASNVFFVGLA